MLDSDASTAKTLTLVALILEAIVFVIGIFLIFAVVALIAMVPAPGTTTTVSLSGIGIVTLVFSFSFVIGILWILLDYFLVYKKLAEEKVKEAETPSLVLGIIQLIIGGVIPGILLIVAYVKIRDSLERSARQVPTPPSS